MNKKESTPSLRELVNITSFTKMAERLVKNHKEFGIKKICLEVSQSINSLTLLDRVSFISDMLYKYLPKNIEYTINIMLQSQLAELLNTKDNKQYGEFISLAYDFYIAKYACKEQYLDIAMNAFKEMTKRFSCEFSIRYFIIKYEKKVFFYLKKWIHDENVHVRRLCSESIRPRLPWGKKLHKLEKNPQNIFPILAQLYYDSHRYVTRSVANCLNDVSKTHIELVLKHLKLWEQQKKQTMNEFNWIKNHALRTAIKQGHRETLDYLGYQINDNIQIQLTLNKNNICIGEKLYFELLITQNKPKKLMIDYIIYFMKKNNQHNQKVFKLKNSLFPIGETSLKKSHSFQLRTSRALYVGIHKIAIQINGKLVTKKEFFLNEKEQSIYI